MIWFAIVLALVVMFYVFFPRSETPKMFEKKISKVPPAAPVPAPVAESLSLMNTSAKPKKKYGGKVKKTK